MTYVQTEDVSVTFLTKLKNLINSYQKHFISFMQLKSTVILGYRSEK